MTPLGGNNPDRDHPGPGRPGRGKRRTPKQSKTQKPRRKTPDNTPVQGPETMEFRREFEANTDKILRGRLLWFIIIWGGLSVIASIFPWIAAVDVLFDSKILGDGIAQAFHEHINTLVFAVVQLLWTAFYAAALVVTIKGSLTRQQAVWMSIALIVADGLAGIAFRASGMDQPGTGVWSFAVSHLVASLVFPWTARQAALPALIVLTVNALSRLLIEPGPLQSSLILIALSPLVAMPGCLIAWARHSRRLGHHQNLFVRKRYVSLRQELASARSIHESMFPNPRTGRNVNFTYKYEPMRQIGGDYLFASHCPTDDGTDECLSVVLLDVTGHGIPAALTVNRLHGEIELLFADDPFIAPGEVLRRLNRYVHLTLARHSIFVTAVCLKADPKHNTLAYASGGHPPPSSAPSTAPSPTSTPPPSSSAPAPTRVRSRRSLHPVRPRRLGHLLHRRRHRSPPRNGPDAPHRGHAQAPRHPPTHRAGPLAQTPPRRRRRPPRGPAPRGRHPRRRDLPRPPRHPHARGTQG
jgi:hypothetical protein